MEDNLNGLVPQLESAIDAALRQQLVSNRGTFAPFRISPVAVNIARALVIEEPQEAEKLGRALGHEGLSLGSLTAAQTAALDVIAHYAPPEKVGALVSQASRACGALIAGQATAERDENQRQRDDMERAFHQVVDTQRAQEAHLRDAIRELSTPIIPVYAGILALPLIGAIDSQRANEITEGLLAAISRHRAAVVILDITGVAIIDTSTANHLLMTTRAVSLLGAQMIMTGINPEIAQSIVHLGIDLQGLVTLANLQSGITYALKRFGLAVQPTSPGTTRKA